MVNKYYEEALEIHKESTIVLMHCDTILYLTEGPIVPKNKVRKLGIRSTHGHVDIPRLLDAFVNCVFFSIYVESVFKPERALRRALILLERFFEEADENSDKLVLFRSMKDLYKAISQNKICTVLSLEGAEPIQESIFLLRIFHRLGIRSIALTWNERNMLADGVWEQRTHGGLTRRGVEYVKEMEKLRILIDVSHLSDASFWDLIDIVHSPIIASHSNCRAICNVPRNLTDEQIEAIAKKGGVIGINFAPNFLVSKGKASIDDVVKHINHIVDLVGIDYVGLGTDFDGISSTPVGLEDVSKLPNLTSKLLEVGYSEKEIKKILGENILRVMKKLWID